LIEAKISFFSRYEMPGLLLKELTAFIRSLEIIGLDD
jgi:hypothetical protein